MNLVSHVEVRVGFFCKCAGGGEVGVGAGIESGSGGSLSPAMACVPDVRLGSRTAQDSFARSFCPGFLILKGSLRWSRC